MKNLLANIIIFGSLFVATSLSSISPPPNPIQLFAATIFLEGSGESLTGKVSIGYTILNRARKLNQSILQVMFAPYQFSAWNIPTAAWEKLKKREGKEWDESIKAAKLVISQKGKDPTRNADHFLNVELVRERYGQLPKWYSPTKVTRQIGRHTFLRLWG